MKTQNQKLDFDNVWLTLQETHKMIKENARISKEHDKKLRKLEDLFVGQWGKLIESLIEGDLVKLLQKRGIKVISTQARTEVLYKGKIIEIDIIALNDTDVIPTEVKTTLSVSDVKRFIEKLKVFNKAFKIFKDKKVFGAIGYLKVQEEADKFAMRQGLFVIRATGSSAVIVNPLDFKPKKF